MDKETAFKIKIANAAARRFAKNEYFTIQSLAEKANTDSETIYKYFPGRSSILAYFYESRIIICDNECANISGYENYSLAEKLSTLCLALLDQFEEYRAFVLQTYFQKRFTASNTANLDFKRTLKKRFKTIFETDRSMSGMATLFQNNLSYYFLACQFDGIIRFWQHDTSTHFENTIALVDKWSAFIEEVFYSKIADKSFDLARFLYYQSQPGKMESKESNQTKFQ